MQSFNLRPGLLNDKVIIPPSKSYANRALILAALSADEITIKNIPEATDVTILLNCFEQIGLLIEKSTDEILVKNSFPECEDQGQELWVGEGGTTARFLAAMLLLGNKPYKLILGERLKQRPWDEFIHLANSLGALVEISDNILSIQGPIKCPEVLEVDCSKTTQFATAFQLLSHKTNTIISPKNLESSLSYWKMTEKVITDMKSSNIYIVPADWSSASYPLAFSALNQKIEFPGLRHDPLQADSKFCEVLKYFGALEERPEGIISYPGKVSGSYNFDVSDALDLVPTLAYYLAHIEGTHELFNVQNLVHKESNRLDEVIKLLSLFERKASSDGNILRIKGNTSRQIREIHLKLPEDHRMVMVGSLFLLHHGGGSITPSDAVLKSYPGFFDLIS